MNVNLELVLVVGVLVTGVVWGLDTALLRARRVPVSVATGAAGTARMAALKDPWYVEYSRSFFPVLLVVLLLRSFVAEPFRIPSESMVPTLLKGDFILVNKFVYGIRLPVLKTKILELGAPHRGDVVVFRYPREPSVDYIKRIVGLPGDQISYYRRELYINGVKQAQHATGLQFRSGVVRKERLGQMQHDILLSPLARNDNIEYRVPAGHYFVMGDNRDNSNDSRVWGKVPEGNLVGKAFFIWMNWDWQDGGFRLDRIGNTIQ